MEERVVAGTAAVARFAGCSGGALVWDERVAREIRNEHRIVGALAGIPQAPKRPHPRSKQRQRDNNLRKERLSADSQGNALRQGEEEEGHKDPDCASDEGDDAGYTRGLPLALSAEETQRLIPLLGRTWLRGGVPGGGSHSTESGCLTQKEDREGEGEIQERGAEASPHGRVLLFADLHRRGFTMTCGAKFGADFLAYRGDPREVHSLLMVKAVGEDQAVPALHLLTLARLALAARKHLVLAATKGPDPALASSATQGLSEASSRLQSQSPPIARASDLHRRGSSCQEGSCASAIEACQLSPAAQQGSASEPCSVLAPQHTGPLTDSQTGPPDPPQAPSFTLTKLPDYYTVTVDLGFIPRESKTEGHKMRAL